MAFKEIRKSTATEMVAEQILEKLDNGELQPGAKLPSQRELANLLGVGRSSIREAINALAVMGYLDVIQGKGTFIREEMPSTDLSISKLNAALKAGTIFDLMEAKEVLDCKSSELAAERADKKHIKQLKEAIDMMAGCGSNYDKFLAADAEFHTRLADATDNAIICEMTKLVLEKVIEHHSLFQTHLSLSQYRKISVQTAKKVVEYVEKGDGKKAAKWMHNHLNAIISQLREIIS